MKAGWTYREAAKRLGAKTFCANLSGRLWNPGGLSASLPHAGEREPHPRVKGS